VKSLLVKLFVKHWPRKMLSLFLASIIWLVVSHSLTATRTLNNIPVRIINIPEGKTVEGLQPNNRLTKRLNVTLVGNKSVLEELTPYDFEIVLDAQNRPDDWSATLSTNNIISLNREIDISSGIKRLYHPNLLIRMTTVATDKIPVIITQPIGEAPRGYQFLDVWPYRLFLSVTGPEAVVRQLKMKEHRITFNLSDISKAQLDALYDKTQENSGDVISFAIPDQWKQLLLPALSEQPISFNDPQAKLLRLDFIPCRSFPIETPLPVALYFPLNASQTRCPESISLASGEEIKEVRGIPLIAEPLYAAGIDRLFLEIVKNRMQIVVDVTPEADGKQLTWSVQFINPRSLENIYVNALLSDVSGSDVRLMKPLLREEYLRNRFRSYMNNLQLFHSDQTPFAPIIELKDQHVVIYRK